LAAGSFDYAVRTGGRRFQSDRRIAARAAECAGSRQARSKHHVTANIDPVQAAALAAASRSAAHAAAGGAQFSAALSDAQRAADGVDSTSPSASADVPPSPPPELAAHIEAAARAWDVLAGAGQHVSFSDNPDGRLSIELRDESGNHLETLSGAALFGLIDRAGGS
jgi:hypothetical protein